MIGENEVIVIDDLVNIEYQNYIKDILIGEESYKDQNFPWYYTEDVTGAGDYDSQHRTALGHNYVELLDDDKTTSIISNFHELFVPMLKKACSRVGMYQSNVIQGRSFLQFPLNLKNPLEPDTPHIDIYRRKHLVVLYYVCDSDGDTIIYNEREYERPDGMYTIKQKVTPKQGRAVLFDGMLMHTAMQPINNIRCVVNYNLD